MLSKEKKQQILKIGGIVGVVAGSVSLYFSGSTESSVIGLVGGVFVFIGIILNVLSGEKQ